MPSENATRFELAVYVEPEHVEKFRELLDERDVGNVCLSIEHVIGQLLDSDIPSYTAGAIMRPGPAPYGEGVAEVQCEDVS